MTSTATITSPHVCSLQSNETFLGVASVISRPAICQVSVAGEHFFCVNGSRAMLKLLPSTRA